MSAGPENGTTGVANTSGGDSGANAGKAALRWQECFAAAIEYFHGQIDESIQDHTEDGKHPERAATARKYYQDRGWNDETIEDLLLGWAPPESGNNLKAHLDTEGYTQEEMLATGLFTEELKPLWHGRYVFPYLDEGGSPVYAISRSTGKEGGGKVGYDGHPADFMSGKYAKIAHTKEYARVSEPIFGKQSVCDSQPIIITEGIADAITTQQAGYACISPVTTQFSRDDLDDLLALIEARDVSRVYVIQDAERPSIEPDEDYENLEITQFGSGVAGAIKTATFLTENGVDARVNTPPRPGLRKVDVDDYFREGWGTLEPLLQSAKPPEQHPAYDDPEQLEQSAPSSLQEGSPELEGTGNKSGLFNLDMTDVTGLSQDYRGKNPLGHKGDSEDYFVISDNRECAYDHKRHVGYTSLTYLLCAAGERPVDGPVGGLSNREMFIAWKYAKENGLLSADDPVPHRGLVYIAIDRGLCTRDDMGEGQMLPLKAYNTALEIIRDEYGLEPSREPYDTTSPSEDLRRTPVVAENQSDSITLTMDEARERCQSAIDRALAQSQYSLIDALPAQGKSRGVVEWAAKNDTPLTVLAPRRELLSDEYAEWCDELGLDYYKLPAFHRSCECASGEHGKDWEQKVKRLYSRGVTAGEIHGLAEKKYGRQLPCQQGGTCPCLNKQDFTPSEYDVLLGHYKHAYQEDIVEGRVVAIDESPTDSFVEGFTHKRVDSAVTSYLRQHESIPFDSYTDLTSNRTDKYRVGDTLELFHGDQKDAHRDGCSAMMCDSDDAHACAPVMIYALLTGDDLGNGWEHAALPEGQICVRNCEPNQEHDEKELSVLKPPALADAERVIALDGTPWPRQWDLCIGTSLANYQVLDSDERVAYLKETLDLTIFQMSKVAKSYSSGTWVKKKQLKDDATLLNYAAKRERCLPDLITSQKAISKYRDAGMLELVNESKHYGDFMGSNTFKHSRVGVVAGSPHYGDTHIEKWGAFAGEAVERRGDGKGMNLDYGSVGNEILQDMRENEVLQAVMRFGRDGDGTTVYVSTAALPEWVPVADTGKVRKWSNGMRQLLAVLRDMESDEWRTNDLLVTEDGSDVLDTDAADAIGKRQVRRKLDELADLGYLNQRKESCGWVWIDAGLADIDSDREVVFGA